MQTQPSKAAIITAFTVAILADLIQVPLTLVSLTGVFTVPVEALDFGLDAVVMGVLSLALGFNLALVPALLAEWVPLLDLLPTWTAVVALLVWQRKRQAPIVTVVPEPARPATAPPTLPAPVINDAVEQRLVRLAELLHKGHISQTEHDEKRKRILAEL